VANLPKRLEVPGLGLVGEKCQVYSRVIKYLLRRWQNCFTHANRTSSFLATMLILNRPHHSHDITIQSENTVWYHQNRQTDKPGDVKHKGR
jgi:hypothetical protein